MPARPAELARTETLKPFSAEPRPGDEVRISRTILAELYERSAEAIGAVERLNTRIIANGRLWSCTSGIWRTGKAPPGCAAPDP